MITWPHIPVASATTGDRLNLGLVRDADCVGQWGIQMGQNGRAPCIGLIQIAQVECVCSPWWTEGVCVSGVDRLPMAGSGVRKRWLYPPTYWNQKWPGNKSLDTIQLTFLALLLSTCWHPCRLGVGLAPALDQAGQVLMIVQQRNNHITDLSMGLLFMLIFC